MRIDKLEVRNFKLFAEQTFTFHPQFTLLVGKNGSGKTSVLDALAVALGALLPQNDPMLTDSDRPIQLSEIRTQAIQHGDRKQFELASHASVTVDADYLDSAVHWGRETSLKRQLSSRSPITLSPFFGDLPRPFASLKIDKESGGVRETSLPIIAYYGAGRGSPPNQIPNLMPRKTFVSNYRWQAFYHCLDQSIDLAELDEWFKREAIAAFNRGRTYRPGFEVVRRAVQMCVPGADDIWYDEDGGIVLSISGNPQPIGNLSAGQRMMLAMVADIAIKAVTQNNYLVPPDELGPEDEPLPRVLAQTPGVVLIDELEVHLHPRWQRQIVHDLKRTFPKIQFICTSHSPQIIGELEPEEIRLLDEPHVGEPPAHSWGMDSNVILEEIMGAESRNEEGAEIIRAIEDALEIGDLDEARKHLATLKQRQHGITPDTAGWEAAINSMEALADADD